jgi:hypothetical protein
MTVNAGPWQYQDLQKEMFVKNNSIETKQTLPKPNKRCETTSYSRYDDGFITPTNSNQVIVDGENFFTGWKCNVGDSIFISPNGEVSLASCGQGGVVGHILEDISKVGPKQITCFKKHCHCGTDIIIPKFKAL